MEDSDSQTQPVNSEKGAADATTPNAPPQKDTSSRKEAAAPASPKGGGEQAISPRAEGASPSRGSYPPHYYSSYAPTTYGVPYPPPTDGSAPGSHYYPYPVPTGPASSGRSGSKNAYGYNPGFVPSQHARVPASPARDDRNGHPPPPLKVNTNAIEELEAQRLEAAAAMDLALSMVKPMQTDFHFFVQDHKETFLEETKREISKHGGDENDMYLVNTNLNSRMMKAWEDLPSGEKAKYVSKEEDDRKRFTEEEEVASRHCATLTARSNAAKRGGKDSMLPASLPKKTRA